MNFYPHNNQPVNYGYMRPPGRINAYPTDIPIYVDGKNINKPPYKALNYHPDGARPAVYVPVSEFSKAGAIVSYDGTTQTIYVSTDEAIDDKLISLDAWHMAYDEISKAVETQDVQNKVRFNGMMDHKFVFNSEWWKWDGYGAPPVFTVGKYYNYSRPGGMEFRYLTVMDDRGERTRFSAPKYY